MLNAPRMRLYDSTISGNCYKIRLVVAQLELPCEIVPVDILKKESQTPEFQKKNLQGRVPVLELDDGHYLSESAAILLYLAEGTELLPQDRWERALVHQWLFFEQNQHEPEIASARFIAGILKKEHEYPEVLRRMRARGNWALNVMDQHLSSEPYFVGGRYTVADIALYAYTHVAEEGGFDLARYPAVGRWLARVRALPRHIPLLGKAS